MKFGKTRYYIYLCCKIVGYEEFFGYRVFRMLDSGDAEWMCYFGGKGSEELNRSDRKFMFLCGHDSNLASIGAAPGLQFPETENALELPPIGSKLVFEKWSDGTDEYVAINLVFQAIGQLHGRALLSLNESPMVLPVTIKGLPANNDGLYCLSDLDILMANAMAEYEAIEDAE